jgi:hypothetical protein
VAIKSFFTIVLPIGEFYDPIVDRFDIDQPTKSLLNSYPEAGDVVNRPGKVRRYADNIKRATAHSRRRGMCCKRIDGT